MESRVISCCLLLLVYTAGIDAQGIGINTSMPHASALVDLTSTDKGLLIPRMSTAQRNAIASPATALLIYDNTILDFYYYTGSGWRNLLNSKTGWAVNGNSGTMPTSHFIGTTDNNPLKFRVNNIPSGQLNAAQSNVAFGLRSLNHPSPGIGNIAIGDSASMNSPGNNNVVIGSNAGAQNTASWTTLIGFEAGKLNTAQGNVFVGANAGRFNTSGMTNTFVGDAAGASNSTGSGNTALGSFAFFADNTGEHNTAIGALALTSSNAASNNTALGYHTLMSATSGYSNVAVGSQAMTLNQSGYSNVAVGSFSLATNQSGHSNVAVGENSLASNSSGYWNVGLGMHTLLDNATGNENTAVGTFSLRDNSDGVRNTALGFSSLLFSIGDDNTAAGAYALDDNIEGSGNTAVGGLALTSNQDASNNTGVGFECMYSNISGTNNSALGYRAMFNNAGSDNTGVGVNVMLNNTSGANNTAMGTNALYLTTGSSNVAVGAYAGDEFDFDDGNTFVGAFTDASEDSLSNCIALGFEATAPTSNSTRIGNSLMSSISGYAPWSDMSDGRYKQDVRENIPGLAFIMKLRPVSYHLNVSDLSKYLGEFQGQEADSFIQNSIAAKEAIEYSGFIAQEVEMAASEIDYNFSGVDRTEGEDGLYGLRYSSFVVPIVKAVQEQEAKIQSQQSEIETLKNEIVLLKKAIENIRDK